VIFARKCELSNPMKRPDPPNPAITLPTIKAFIVGAAPHNAEPASNMIILPMKRIFISKMPYSAALDR